MPDSQSGFFCTRSEISHFEIVESDKEGGYSASDEACEDGSSKFVRTIGLNKWSCCMARCQESES